MELKNFKDTPNSSGCYLFKDSKGIILYIGKAKDLRKRVSSYFQKKVYDQKTLSLIKEAENIDYIITNTEVEALILENNLIKKHKPKFNIDLKDSRRYAFIQLTDESVPRFIIARKKIGEGNFYGPFVSGAERDYVLKTLNKTFKLRTCKKLPKKVCLRYHLGLCSGPCEGKVKVDEYSEQVRKAKLVLRGKTKEIIEKLENEMQNYSDKLEFEKALEVKRQIKSIEYLNEVQNVERDRDYDEDIINYVVADEKVYLALFKIYKGVLDSKQEYVFSYYDGFFEDFLTQYYSENKIVREIIIPKKVSPIIKKYLEKIYGKKVRITVPNKGDKKNLIELVKKNIQAHFLKNNEKLQELQEMINLNEIPRIIECFDISHLSGTSTVGSMICFRDAKPDKSNYRRFKIRTVNYIDDFAAIKEIVKRRYNRLIKEKQKFPDLVIIDGGKGQLSSALEALRELELKIPVVSIAKKLEEIYVPGRITPIKASRKNKGLQLVQEIRDEAHRFAISYSRLLRKNKTFAG